MKAQQSPYVANQIDSTESEPVLVKPSIELSVLPDGNRVRPGAKPPLANGELKSKLPQPIISYNVNVDSQKEPPKVANVSLDRRLRFEVR